MRTLHSRKSINRSPLRLAFLLIPLVFVCFGLSPVVRAVVPAPDGGYPGFNTAEGTNALFSLTSGAANTAIGFDALFHNTTGPKNTAIGFEALFQNTTGFENAATGWRALSANTTGFHNTADGFSALSRTTTGNHNTAIGDEALGSNTTGNFNTTDGAHSLEHNTTGTSNTALGFRAGNSVTTADNVICIGAGVLGANESNSCFIGNVFGRPSSDGTAVFINSSGKLGTMPSSRRFKEEIEPMAQASEGLFALKPVTFRYKKGIDSARLLSFGLIAEEVAEISPELITRNKQGKPETVRYEAVNAMLLNEFLKEHSKGEQQDRKIEEQGARIAEQQKQIQALMAMVREQAAQIQKVSARLEINQAVPQMVSE